jgi:hypothetical protein
VNHSCAIQAGSGAVICWGSNSYGQQTPPPSVDGTSGTASAIAAGGGHSCAIQAGSGAVVCWGDNSYGQATPPPSIDGSDGTASAIAAGGLYSLAIGQAPDADRDSVDDAQDGCLGAYNPDQLDTNQNGYGNACDADYDGDGVVGVSDFVRLGAAFGTHTDDPGFDPGLDAEGDAAIGMSEFMILGRSFGGAPGPSGLSCAGSVPCPVP